MDSAIFIFYLYALTFEWSNVNNRMTAAKFGTRSYFGTFPTNVIEKVGTIHFVKVFVLNMMSAHFFIVLVNCIWISVSHTNKIQQYPYNRY